ncbi:ABC transporter ATP-binding protein [Arcobacter aquimarinus]|uniref:Iron(III)/spermidine/putrescine ABC transporter, ATP-binding protein n=1 Tax=Arcobacter aquimarinus TaxID=1315211 RepID=A0AAE7E2E9_9BACT|nr:ABC transporter ATP-binding protein [Arcobacter aquimarinus]QKE26887.1 iron(III)/spermidine/putrescine ABC transporter, ATP-binding protein [Arcobacter aquimarinus]RXI36109.1 ABC transporter ATP-binding protein [Arcobacter aquimarinus]
MNEIVQVKNLQKIFCKGNICIANKINLSINEGEIFTILGKSGSGKTTFLRMIAGLETPDDGEISVDNKTVFSKNTNLSPKDRKVAVVFQNYALLPHLSISSNITFGSKASKDELEDVLEKTKLKGQENKFPHELSGGQQQRVALARAIINKAKILLLDEPLSNIDTELRSHLRTELKEMIKAFNITALFITHDKEDAFYLSDRIAIMHGGNILQVGTAKEVYHHPKDLYCANFLGKITQLEDNTFIRPEHIEICPNGQFEAVIENIVFYGSFYEITINTGNKILLVHSYNDHLEIGQKIKYKFNGELLSF